MPAELLDLAHAEDGHIVQSVDFDYDEVDRSFHPVEAEPAITLTPEDCERAFAMLKPLLKFICQTSNDDGNSIRSWIVAWIFIPELRQMTLTDLAKGTGKDKQSFGRWHDQFKKSFPYIKTPHMQ